ncbi:hypothetical protein MANES_18G084235v8 [Manihot esculenta]|uniref:Uncharacterized protein n=1 Tax=Manihot esculenta TaxID=3983 RepID=A0ACB7FZH9_MANES|nr:hypothetical protein MANES_18G084235v8 [Manihot esculenta]
MRGPHTVRKGPFACINRFHLHRLKKRTEMDGKQNQRSGGEQLFLTGDYNETVGSSEIEPRFKPKNGSVFPRKKKSVKSMMLDTVASVFSSASSSVAQKNSKNGVSRRNKVQPSNTD